MKNNIVLSNNSKIYFLILWFNIELLFADENNDLFLWTNSCKYNKRKQDAEKTNTHSEICCENVSMHTIACKIYSK